MTEMDKLKARILLLEEQLEKTADGVLIFECENFYCPKCGQEISESSLHHDMAYCWNCRNPNDGTPDGGSVPLPLSLGMLLSKPKS